MVDPTDARRFDAASWQQADAALQTLLDLPPDQRPAGLRAMDLPDAVRARVTGMLAAQDQTGPVDGDAFVALGALPDNHLGGLEGREFGRYRLQSLLGFGGMSSVYRAVRADGAFQAPVAFKLLSPALLGSDWRQRFARETRLLAGLRHPGIAALLDAGVADDGTPWLVTELVEGEAIDRYCQTKATSARDRVALVLQLCQALAYVQRHLIVHRDVKCANVMVDRDGQVKLLDFGIARVLGSDGDGDAQATATRVFTPDYAAPEQIDGGPVTTATDVFSVGVLLYRLLTGTLPFTTAGARTDRPTPPSRQVAGSSARQPVPSAGGIDRDLDNIAGKALATEPELRYSSAQALADDLDAWLHQRPVAARRPTLGYRLSLFLRRRTDLAAGIALTVAVAAVGIGATLWQSAEARRQAEQALQAQARASASVDFLTDLFDASDPDVADGAVPDARDLLATGAQRVGEAFAGTPAVQAELLITLARIHRKLGDGNRAEELLAQASGAAAELPADLRLRLALESVAAQIDRQEYPRALAELDRHEAELAPWIDPAAQVRFDILRVQSMARVDEGMGPALALGRDLLGRLHLDAVTPGDAVLAHSTLLGQLTIAGELDEAQRVGELALALLAAGHGSPTNHIAIYNNLAGVERRLGRIDAAIERRSAALDAARRLYPAPSFQHAYVAGNLGGDLASAGRLGQALATLQDAEAMFAQVYERPNSRTAAVDNNLGWVLMALEREPEALFHLERGLGVDRASKGDAHVDVLISRSNRAVALSRLGEHARAEAELLAILEASRQQFGETHSFVLLDKAALAEHYLRAERPAVALDYATQAVAGWRQQFPDGHPRLLAALGLRARALGDLDRIDTAGLAWAELLDLATTDGVAVDHNYLDLLDHYSRFLVEHHPGRASQELPTLLADPRVQAGRERPQWQRIVERSGS